MKKLSIFALLVLLLAACSTTTKKDNGGGNASNQATAVEALDVNEDLVLTSGERAEYDLSLSEKVGLPFGFVPSERDFHLILNSPVSEWDCSESTVSGDATDADDDGIAVDATYEIKCTVGFGKFAAVERTGTLVMKDANDNDPYSGYHAEGDITYTIGKGIFTVNHKFNRTWTRSDSGYDYEHSSSWSWGSSTPTPGSSKTTGESHTIKYAHAGSYTPDQDDNEDPFDAGWIKETATAEQYHGDKLQEKVDSEVNLHLNTTCSPAPKADKGTVKYSWTVSNGDEEVAHSVTVEFEGCGQFIIKERTPKDPPENTKGL